MRRLMRSFAAVCAAATTLAIAGCTDAGEITAPDAPVHTELSIPILAEDPIPIPLPPVDDTPGDRVYAVKIENLTTGQPLSPGVLATHKEQVHLFRAGTSASEGMRLIAEEGNPSVAVKELQEMGGVYEVIATDAPVHRIGGPGSSSLTVRIRAGGEADRLSLATMLVCTNDGFTGADGVELPEGFHPETHYAMAYDAGTEKNDELTRSLADGCGMIGPVSFPANGNGRNPANEKVITPHRGIQGVGHLIPSRHGWDGPVARITIARQR